ncbi:MAG: hypothetical protein AYK19_22545 [Theionarchaea archaeon DG-70-1]|nr:MAG: hypothetical protein AYK19_22545 [Theionarchaea archaeon DG-70-1]
MDQIKTIKEYHERQDKGFIYMAADHLAARLRHNSDSILFEEAAHCFKDVLKIFYFVPEKTS